MPTVTSCASRDASLKILHFLSSASGIANYCERYGDMIWDMSARMGPTPKMDPNSAETKRMERELLAQVPLEQLNERRQ